MLEIRLLKSLRNVELSCRRVNLFIGGPNTGQSNILEALGFLAWPGWCDSDLSSFVRFEHLQNLFCDNLTDEPLGVEVQGQFSGSVS